MCIRDSIAGVRKALDACNHPALLFVDGVSSVASIDFRMDEWGVDLCVSGSQKGFMLPTGLGIVCASEKALACRENSNLPKTFFDWNHQIKTNDLGYFPYTPPMNLLRGLRESVNILNEEGLENVFARHKRHADATRLAVEAWGLEILAKNPKERSNSITAILIRIIFKLKLADIIINVTSGGPGGATDSVTSFIFREYRDRSNVGYGTFLAIFYFINS